MNENALKYKPDNCCKSISTNAVSFLIMFFGLLIALFICFYNDITLFYFDAMPSSVNWFNIEKFNFITAFIFGILSFLSPYVFPLIIPYLCYFIYYPVVFIRDLAMANNEKRKRSLYQLNKIIVFLWPMMFTAAFFMDVTGKISAQYFLKCANPQESATLAQISWLISLH